MNDFVLCSHFCVEIGLFDSSFALMTFHKYILQVYLGLMQYWRHGKESWVCSVWEAEPQRGWIMVDILAHIQII